jgi:hypothetical protein
MHAAAEQKKAEEHKAAADAKGESLDNTSFRYIADMMCREGTSGKGKTDGDGSSVCCSCNAPRRHAPGCIVR